MHLFSIGGENSSVSGRGSDMQHRPGLCSIGQNRRPLGLAQNFEVGKKAPQQIVRTVSEQPDYRSIPLRNLAFRRKPRNALFLDR